MFWGLRKVHELIFFLDFEKRIIGFGKKKFTNLKKFKDFSKKFVISKKILNLEKLSQIGKIHEFNKSP